MWIDAAAESEVNRVMRITQENLHIALFRLEDGLYALEDTCSHEYAPLSAGEIWDGEVYCTRHGSAFDIKTGAVNGLPATRPVKTFPVKVEGGRVYINTGKS